MKAILNNPIRLGIVIVCAVLLAGPAMSVAEETLLLASLTRTRQADEFKNYDFFPEYHREAQKNLEARRAEKTNMLKKITVQEKVVSDAEWLSKNAIIPYEIMTADYVGLIERVISKTKNLF